MTDRTTSQASTKVSASGLTIFSADFINHAQYTPAAPKSLQAENPPPVGQDRRGLRQPGRRWPWCRPGSDARGPPGRGGEGGAGRRSRASETRPEIGRNGSGSGTRRPG